MLEIRAQFSAILLLDPERGQDGRDGPENHGVDIVVMKPLLFGQRLGDNSPDILVRMAFIDSSQPESSLDDSEVIV